jgi:hypothetical protein
MNSVQRQHFANGRQMAQMALALLLQLAADAAHDLCSNSRVTMVKPANSRQPDDISISY